MYAAQHRWMTFKLIMYNIDLYHFQISFIMRNDNVHVTNFVGKKEPYLSFFIDITLCAISVAASLHPMSQMQGLNATHTFAMQILLVAT